MSISQKVNVHIIYNLLYGWVEENSLWVCGYVARWMAVVSE